MNSCSSYESGDRLSPEHEKTILEKLLPFHPESEKKIGCGIDYITVYVSFPLSLTLRHSTCTVHYFIVRKLLPILPFLFLFPFSVESDISNLLDIVTLVFSYCKIFTPHPSLN